jgi:hypothetical protein
MNDREERDYAFTIEDGAVLAHRADCAEARKQAAQGKPVMTAFGCQGLPAGTKTHECLQQVTSNK